MTIEFDLARSAPRDIEAIGVPVGTEGPVPRSLGFTRARLAELGVRVVIYPRLLTACAIKGMQNGLAALKEATAQREPLERPELLSSFEELNTVVGFDEFKALEQKLAGR